MSTNDLVSDMLTRIRNICIIKCSEVYIIQTKLTISIAKILKEEGFIEDFICDFFVGNLGYLSIRLKFKGLKRSRYITGLKRISRPGFRSYVGVSEIPKVLGGIGLAILSTSKGLMTGQTAKINNIGGEVLFFIW
uniref:Small ribosomal subunit protein uS8c n=1 Tax=Phacus pleuronectes TaxID=102908 RepID=A0A3G3LLT8_9EUGL|nr:ribosomal protein S8 [Phacus pleuronectes]AYQ93671.1 ribosomal protein S8 [Phacus pleuronectes]